MKFQIEAVIRLLALFAAKVWGQDSALTCSDFRPTPEALQRFPDLKGACESVVERANCMASSEPSSGGRPLVRSRSTYRPPITRLF